MGVWPEGLRLIRNSAGMGSMFSTTRGAFTTRSHPEAAHAPEICPVKMNKDTLHGAISAVIQMHHRVMY